MPIDSCKHHNQSKLFLPILFCASMVLLSIGAFIKGPFISVDTAKFLGAGERILVWMGSQDMTTEDLEAISLFPHYLISSIALSSIHTYLGLREWGVMIFNSLLFSAIVCTVFSVWRTIYPSLDYPWCNKTAFLGVCGGVYIIFGLPDGFLWSYAILTDILFLFWIALFVIFVEKGFLGASRLMWFLAFLMAVTAPFVRPPGILVPLLYCWALMLYTTSRQHETLKSFVAVSIITPAFLVLIIAPYIVLMFMDDKRSVEWFIPDTFKDDIQQAAYYFKEGIIISNRVEVEVATPLTYKDILQTMVHRLAYYWVPVRLGEHAYSVVHNLVNIMYMVCVIPLLIKGLMFMINVGKSHTQVALFLVMTAYLYALLHAVTLVSFDWRYQLPGMVPLWILAGCGLFSLLGLQPAKRQRT